MTYLLLLSVLFSAQASKGAKAATASPNNCDKYLGVWEYVDPSPPGRSIISKYGDTYASIWVGSDIGAAAEITCGAKRDKFRIVHSVKPAEVGTEFELEAETTADGLRWWVIGPDGKRGDMGAARRLK
jgi:hypothetical protein